MKLFAENSRRKYEAVYKAFMDWWYINNVNEFSEKILLAYFTELSEKCNSLNLWSHYSILKTTLNINNSINIESFTELRAFLKRKGEGYLATKTKAFTPYDINQFIYEAPDNIYLVTKVALIMGLEGACHATELHSLNIEHVQDLGSTMVVTVPNAKTNINRKFTITGHFYKICKQYTNLRPTTPTSTPFFLHYENGKCTQQKISVKNLAGMSKKVAKFLKLPNLEMYTAHSFRRSSCFPTY